MHTTVAICTRNRATLLDGALREACAQARALGDASVLVVDNGSTDETRAVVLGHPGVRYVFEGAVGLSNARNSALEHAEHGVLVYLDDDAVPQAGWLEALRKPLLEDSRIAAVGGRIVPSWSAAPPAWVKGALVRSAFSLLERTDAFELNTTPRTWICGASFAIRTSALKAVGGYSDRLGRKGESLLSGEEELVFRRLIARGDRVVYRPDAVVAHIVHEERLRRRWVLRRFFAQGVSNGILEGYRVTENAAQSIDVPKVERKLGDVPEMVARHANDSPFELACLCAEVLGYAWQAVKGRR